MNKKQMLKEQKKLKQQQKEVATLFKDDKEVYKVFKIAGGVLLFIALAFVLINILNGSWNLFTKNNKQATEIDPSMLIAGTLFNREEDEYLALVYDMKDEKYAFYTALASNYSSEKHLYFMDLASGFNQNFVGSKTVISNDLSKLKFSGPTLLTIKADKITKSYTTEKDIVKVLSGK
jgi:hypothetical protein